MKHAVIIGGGPAGMMAAGIAAERGLQVTLLEKNSRLGKKLAITGKGRCNITNACEVEELIAHVPTNPSFLYSAFYSFTNDQVCSFFQKLGVETKVERGGRVFPVSDKAMDVVSAMERFVKQSGVNICYQSAHHIIKEDGRVTGVALPDGRAIQADAVCVATGGMSYPLTGSTGDGYRLAQELGHTIVSPKPSLVPLCSSAAWVKEAQGLALKNCAITVWNGKDKKIYDDFGELLFTHYGISGPVILSASSHMQPDQPYRVSIDLKPALDLEKLDKRICRDFQDNSRRHFENALSGLLPKKLIPVVVALSEIPPNLPVHQITREQRRRLGMLLKDLTVPITGFRPLAEAVITSGGVKTTEVNPSTMESKLVQGLYFAGEVLDVDAYTGGFNLQIAFSTGHLAGENM